MDMKEQWELNLEKKKRDAYIRRAEIRGEKIAKQLHDDKKRKEYIKKRAEEMEKAFKSN